MHQQALHVVLGNQRSQPDGHARTREREQPYCRRPNRYGHGRTVASIIGGGRPAPRRGCFGKRLPRPAPFAGRPLECRCVRCRRGTYGCRSLSWPPSAAATHATKAPITMARAVSKEVVAAALRAASASLRTRAKVSSTRFWASACETPVCAAIRAAR